MDPTTLLDFVQRKLDLPLNEKNAQKLLDVEINGSAFLQGAKDETFFAKAGLAFGPSVNLRELVRMMWRQRA